MSDVAGVDPHRLVAAMEAAGFTIVGRGRAYVRLGHPGFDMSLLVPLDRSAPEFGELTTAALDTLRKLAEVGGAARRALGESADRPSPGEDGEHG